MPLQGNPLATAFSTINKQTITGNGTVGPYTLDYPAGSDQDVEVFVNNVRQEPGVAYTVAGTAMTMTGVVQSSDDFYVVFQGKAQQTVSHPAGSPLQATSGTFSGDLTVDTNTLYVDSTNNRVGIANASPSVELDVTGAAKVSGDLTVDSNTLYVDSTNNRVGVGTTSPASAAHISSSTYPQIEIDDKASRNYAMGVTSSSFRIRDVTGTADRLTIDSSGNLLVGTTTGGGTIGTYDGFGALSVGTFFSSATSNRSIFSRRSTDGSIIDFRKDSTTVGSISVTGSATAYNTSSDYRLKENVVADWDATTRLKQLNPVRFNFIADPDTTVDGFLAHEVQSVVPEAITGTHNEVDDDGNPVYQGIDQSKLVPLLVKTIQELEARITALENA